MSVQFYPPLTSIMSLEDLPEALDFLQEPLTDMFNKVYFRDFQHTKGAKGDSAFYRLTLIVFKELGFEIPGTGIMLVLNPPANNTSPGKTEIPVTLHYEWKVLRLKNAFSMENFSYNPIDFFNLVSEIIDVPPQSIVHQAINEFAGTDDINGYVDDINAKFGLAIPHPPAGSVETAIQSVMSQLESATGLPAVSLLFPLYLIAASDGNTFDNLGKLFKAFLGGQSVKDFVLNLLIPTVEASIGVGVGLVFPRDILMPLDETVGDNYGKPLPDPAKTILTFDIGDFSFSTEKGIGYENDLVADLPFCGIGTTGLTLEIDQAKLDISKKTNIPEATADGRPNDFVGVYIKEARIGLPQWWVKDTPGSSASIFGRNLIIGTGGISGKVGMEANVLGTPSPLLVTTLGSDSGFSIGLNKFEIEFKQNSIIGSSINGFLTIPGFDDKNNPGNPAKIGVDVAIGNDSFQVTAAIEQGIALNFADIFELTIFSLTVGRKEDDRFYIAASGKLLLTASAPGSADPLLPVALDIKKILIYDDGSFEFEGGVSLQTDALTMKLGPVDLSITAIHLGSHAQTHLSLERKYAYFGFDGGVSLDPVGVDARGDGIKFYFTTDAGGGKPFHSFVRIEGIGIDLVIPGDANEETAALLLSGYLSMKSPESGGASSSANTEYMGGVEFSLPKVGLSGSAAMRLTPKVPAFLVDVGLELPAPILLGATGLGIYGFRGLVGSAYVPTKSAAGVNEDDPWWAYYKAKTPPVNKEGVQISKFEQKDGFSIGAGISLATAPDAGRTFSSKIFFLLGLPEVFLLQGQGAILAERIGLDNTKDPPFFALISITSSSVEAAFGVNYNVPEGGEVLKLQAVLEMGFFFGNASSWYINVGRDEPEEKRIRARIFNLFDGYAFLMLSSSGIKAGAGVSWEFKKKYGPVSVELGAYLDVGGQISFKPVQIGGFISLGGYARLRVFGFKFGFEASASLAAEAPRPFIVTGKFRLKIGLPWPLPDIKVSVTLTWTFNKDLNLDEIFILDIDAMDTKSPISAINIMTKGGFPLTYLPRRSNDTILAPTSNSWAGNFKDYMVPIDSKVMVEFTKPVKPGGHRMSGITQGYVHHDYVSPKKAKSERVKHEYSVTNVRIKYWDTGSNSWEDFNPFAANTPMAAIANVAPSIINTKPFGYWQYGDLPNQYTKLELLSLSPFSYLTQGTPKNVIIEQLGYEAGYLLCEGEKEVPVCQNWEKPFHTTPITPYQMFQDRNMMMKLDSNAPVILPVPNPFGLQYGIRVDQDGSLSLYFNEPVAQLELKLSSFAECVEIEIYHRVWKPSKEKMKLGNSLYVSSKKLQIGTGDLKEPVRLEDPGAGIAKVVLRPCPCQRGYNQKEAVQLLIGWAKEEYDRLILLAGYWRALLSMVFKCCQEKEGVIYFNSKCRKSMLAVAARIPGFVLGEDPCDQRDEIYQRTQEAFAEGERIRDILIYYGELPPNNERPTEKDPPKNPFACALFLHEACWLTMDQYNFNVTIPSQAVIDGVNEEMVEGMEKLIQPVWRPETKYAIQIETLDKLYIGNSFEKEYQRFYNFGFQTEGGIGHFHQYDDNGTRKFRNDYQLLKNKDKEQEYKLANLKHYLHYGRSYPDAEGKLIGAKPLYYEMPTLSLFFKKEYVYSMFNDWDAYNGLPALSAELEVVIKDPAEGPDGSGSGMSIVKWGAHNMANLEPEVVVINNLVLNGANCSGIIGPIKRPGINAAAQPDFLKPEKLYQAIFTGVYQEDRNEVHKYNFQTSRYPDFESHIGSYILDASPGNQVKAVYAIEVDLNAGEMSLVNDILNDTSSGAHEALRSQYADPYDRLMYGALGIPQLDPPVSTEFNVITNAQSSEIIGILVRSPEPINDPKTPQPELDTTIFVAHVPEGGPLESNFDKQFSKDNAAVFLTNPSRDIAPGSMIMALTYLLWSGQAYTPQTVVLANFDVE